ncbi:MAG: KH domain-containing protein [Defluviitaleaceae bacterium]|nr:KH domain-containing protein [Defluviitaleaceae bacterium]MCL2274150.1 KH domain-containing protein [Defluviitaleaceae bacterium]
MRELLVTIAKNLVENPDQLEVLEEKSNGMTTLKLKVAPEDMGKVIGKQGRIARSIRTVIKAAAIHENVRVNVEIVQ